MQPRSWFVYLLVLIAVFTVASFGVVSAQERQLAAPIIVVNTPVLNIRSGPGPEYTAIVRVRGGTELPVLGANSDFSWYVVATPVGPGWVDVDFVIPRGDFTYVPFIAAPQQITPTPVLPTPQTLGLFAPTAIPSVQQPAQPQVLLVPVVATPTPVQQPSAPLVLQPNPALPVPRLEQPILIVNTARLNIRSGPGGQYTILTSVPGGTTLTPIGVTLDNVWFLVEGVFGRGWVAAEFVLVRGTYDNIPVLLNVY